MKSASGSNSLNSAHPCRVFSLSEIQFATRNFDDRFIIGQGGFGKVYKAQISIEQADYVVAIKRLGSMSDQGEPEFRTEIDMLSKLRHSHLVSLIGYCNENKEMILVYQYMQNGTLDRHLHKRGTPLSWVTRLKIAIGAARGLDYLHTGVGTLHGIIHRDVKTSNILLDENWAAMISDFGLSKIGPTNQPISYINTTIKGTFGYLDPDYFYTRKLTRKSDVYAFGVVLFELLSGRFPVDEQYGEEDCSLVRWAQKCVKERKFDQMVDPKIKGSIFPKCLKQFAQVANRCLHSLPKERPTMTEVVALLQALVELQEKSNHFGQSSSTSILGFSWKIPKYFLLGTGPNSEAEPVDLKDQEEEQQESSHLDHGKVTYASIPPSPRRQAAILQSTTLKSFSFGVLKSATRNFRPDCVLGEGRFGSTFKGWIDEQSLAAAKPGFGTVIAVKRLNHAGIQGHQEWLTEVNYFGRLNHPNVVKLIGYCLEDDHRLLVYEFMPRGSLKNNLFRRSSYFQPLSWNLRIKLALDAAKGLAYLHGPDAKVMYREFKSSNILINSDNNAKLSDFEFATVDNFGTDDRDPVDDGPVIGIGFHSNGYSAHKYMGTGQLTPRSDIYSFGVVLLELLSGRRCIDDNSPPFERDLVVFARPFLTNNQKFLQMMDPQIEGQYPSGVAKRVAFLARRCVMEEPEHRPTADELVRSLEQIQELQKAFKSVGSETKDKHKVVSYPRRAPSGGV